MTDRLELPLRYRRELEALLREHVPDAEVWAYGSRVTGESHPASDLDLVLRGPTLEPLGGVLRFTRSARGLEHPHPGPGPRLGKAAGELPPGNRAGLRGRAGGSRA